MSNLGANALSDQETRGYFSAIGKEQIQRLSLLAFEGRLSHAVSIRIGKGPRSNLQYLMNLEELTNLDIEIGSLLPLNLSKLTKLRHVGRSENFTQSVEIWPPSMHLESLTFVKPSEETLVRFCGLASSLYIYSPPTVFPEIGPDFNTKELKIYFGRKDLFDIRALSRFQALETLSLYRCSGKISNARSLSSLKKLQNVIIFNAPNIDDYEWLFELPNLRRVLFMGAKDLPGLDIALRLAEAGLIAY